MHLKCFLPEERIKYKNDKLVAVNEYIYCCIQRSILHELKQVRDLTHTGLKDNLQSFGNFPAK